MPYDGTVIPVGAGVRIDERELRSIRGSFFNHLDLRFFIIVLISALLHFGGLTYMNHIRLPKSEPMALENIPERFAKLIVEKPLPKETKKDKLAALSSTKTSTTAPVQQPTESTPVTTSSAPVSAAVRAQAKVNVQANTQRVEEKVRSVGVLGMLTGAGSTAKGPKVVNVLGQIGSKERMVDLDKALENMSGLTQAKSVDVLDRKLVRSKDVAILDKREDISNLVASIGSAQSSELSKRGNFVISRPQAIEGAAAASTKRDNDAINAVVSSRKASIRMSYEKYLQLNPQLAGKVTIRFTIAAEGRVTKVDIIENSTGSEELAQDIVRKIKLWEFEAIPDGDVTVTYPFVFSPS